MPSAACSFITAGRDAEKRLVALLVEVDRDVADWVRLRLALGLSVAEVAAARHADVRIIGAAAFLQVRDAASGRLRVLPLGPLHALVVEPRARDPRPDDRLFPTIDTAKTARAFAHAATEFPGISDEAVTAHHAHRTGAPKSSHARREQRSSRRGACRRASADSDGDPSRTQGYGGRDPWWPWPPEPAQAVSARNRESETFSGAPADEAADGQRLLRGEGRVGSSAALGLRTASSRTRR